VACPVKITGPDRWFACDVAREFRIR